MKLYIFIALALLFLAGCSDDKTPDKPSYPRLVKGYYIDATRDETAMFDEAITEDNEILKADCFKNEILTRHFTSTKGLNNAQIFNRLSDHPMTVIIEMFTGDFSDNYINHVYGYEDEGTVYVNRFFVYDVNTAGSLLFHEVLGHVSGFRHRSSTDSTSIPYQLNDIYSVCSNTQNQQKLVCGRNR